MEQARDCYKFLRAKKDPNTIYVLGDSHTDLFTNNRIGDKVFIASEEKKWFLAANYSCSPFVITYHLDAVLAYSLGRFGTTNKVTEKVEYLLEKGFIPPRSYLVLSFGEIDCRVHVKRQSEINSKVISETVSNIVENYIKFAIGLRDKGFIVGIYGPPGSQSDDIPSDPLFPKYGSEEERNRIIEIYNTELSEQCKLHKIYFFSLYKKTVTHYKTEVKLYRDGVHLSESCYEDLRKNLEGIYEHKK